MNYITTFNWNKLLALEETASLELQRHAAMTETSFFASSSGLDEIAVFQGCSFPEAHWLLKISQNIHNGAAIVLHFGDPSWSWISIVSHTINTFIFYHCLDCWIDGNRSKGETKCDHQLKIKVYEGWLPENPTFTVFCRKGSSYLGKSIVHPCAGLAKETVDHRDEVNMMHNVQRCYSFGLWTKVATCLRE